MRGAPFRQLPGWDKKADDEAAPSLATHACQHQMNGERFGWWVSAKVPQGELQDSTDSEGNLYVFLLSFIMQLNSEEGGGQGSCLSPLLVEHCSQYTTQCSALSI